MSDDNTRDAKRAEQAVEAINQVPGILSLTLSEIEVDESFNARKSYDEEKVAAMIDSIKVGGLKNPLQVMSTGKGGYSLVAGFTRMRALTQIEKENRKAGVKEPLRVACKLNTYTNEVDAHFDNLEENTLRENLSTYEIAEKCSYIMETFGESGASVARRIGVGKNQVNNYVRSFREADPRLLELWKDNKVTSDWLVRVVSKPHDEQWAKWEESIGIKADADADDDDDDGEDSGEGGRSGEKVARRPGAAVLNSAIDAVTKSDKSDDWKAGAKAALKFATGAAPKIPGVYDPKKPPAKAKKGKDKGEDRADA